MLRIALLWMVAAVSLPLWAQAPSPEGPQKSYAQALADATVARHPKLLELDMHATPPGGAQSAIIAAKSPGRIGHPASTSRH